MFFRKKKRKTVLLIDRRAGGSNHGKRLRNILLRVWSNLGFLRFLQGVFRGSVIFWGFVILSLGVIGFAFFSPYFQVSSMEIERDNPNFDTSELEQFLSDVYGRNLLFVSTPDLETDLLENFPEFFSVNMKEVWPNTLKVEVVLRKPAWVVFNQETANFSVLSEDGVVLKDRPKEELLTIRVFDYPDELVMGERWVEAKVLDQIAQAYQSLRVDFGVMIEHIDFFPDAREVHFGRQGGGAFWVDLLGEDLEKQLKKLDWGEDYVNFRDGGFEYIDLRIPNQVFVK